MNNSLNNTANTSGKLNIVTALACEARPFIDLYQLQKLPYDAFDVFANKDRSIHLIVSQVGKVNSAAATSVLHCLSGQCKHAVFVNIGIAGCGQLQLSDCVLIHKITDDATQKSWYPFTIKSTLATSALTTFDQASDCYEQSTAMDMEASAFFQTATKFVDHEQVQVIKVISDVDADSAKEITSKHVTKLIQKNMPDIQSTLEKLMYFSANESQQSMHLKDYQAMLKQWHFTNYQQITLKESLRRWSVHCGDINPLSHCQPCNNSTEVINHLNQHLASLPYSWTPST